LQQAEAVLRGSGLAGWIRIAKHGGPLIAPPFSGRIDYNGLSLS